MDFLRLKKDGKFTFIGCDMWSPFISYPIFGGQLAAQSLYAGLLTLENDLYPVILHTIFINPGNPKKPVTYTVENIKEGKTLQMKNIYGKQENGLIVQSTLTLSSSDKKFNEFTSKLEIEKENFCLLNEYIRQNIEKMTNDKKLIEDHFKLFTKNLEKLNKFFKVEIGTFKNRKRQIRIFMSDEYLLNQEFNLLTTFLSDLMIVECALLSSDLSFFNTEIHKVASIDHNLYFVSTKIPEDRVVYYILECVSMNQSKACIEGKIVDSNGTLLCIASQQCLIRLK